MAGRERERESEREREIGRERARERELLERDRVSERESERGVWMGKVHRVSFMDLLLDLYGYTSGPLWVHYGFTVGPH